MHWGSAGWRPLYQRFQPRAEEIAPDLPARSSSRSSAHLEAHWPADLPQGVIHADLFPDNVFFLGDELSGLIDFYFACNDALAYDVAVALNAWCFETDHSFNITKGQALLKGYQSVRTLGPRRARGAAAAGARRRAALPADARLRLAAHGKRCAGQPQGPATSTCAGSSSTAASARPASTASRRPA